MASRGLIAGAITRMCLKYRRTYRAGRMQANQNWSPERATAIIAAEAAREGATLPILHALQA